MESNSTTKEKRLEDKKRDDELEESFELYNCASPYDCTGSVPIAPANEEEWESYDETYHFRPVTITKKE